MNPVNVDPDEVARLERERDLYLRLLNLGLRDDPASFLEEALELVTRVIGAHQGYLEIDPSARPRDAAEVLARLERLAEPGTLVPLVPQVPSPEPRVEQVVRVRATAPRRPVPPPSRAVPILAGVAAVALVAMIGALGWRLLRPTAGDGAERVGPGDDEGVPAQTLSTARAGAGPATGAPVPVPVPVPTVTTTAPSGADDGPAHGTGDATSGGSDDASAEPTVAPPETPTSGTRPTSVTDGARKPATVDSPACKATREAAETAKRAGEWSSVLVHVGTRGCWTGVHRNPALALRVRALFEKVAGISAKRDLPEFRRTETARGAGRRAQANARRDHRLFRIERDAVLVGRDQRAL